MATLNTNKIIYNSGLSEDEITRAVPVSITVPEDGYCLLGNDLNCVFYYLTTLQLTQGQVAEIIEEWALMDASESSDPDAVKLVKDLLSKLTYFRINNNSPEIQVVDRLESLGVTLVDMHKSSGNSGSTKGELSGSNSSGIAVSAAFLTNNYNSEGGIDTMIGLLQQSIKVPVTPPVIDEQ